MNSGSAVLLFSNLFFHVLWFHVILLFVLLFPVLLFSSFLLLVLLFLDQNLQLVRPAPHEALVGVVGHPAHQQRLV